MYSHLPVVVSCVNPKGGVGKSTIAIHFGVAAHRDGRDVTLVDTDPQGSILDWHRLTDDEYDAPLVRHIDADTAVPSAVGGIGGDVLVLDAPARIGRRTASVLQVSDIALVPVRPSGLDLWGTSEFLDLLNQHVGEGTTAAFVGSQRDVRTSLSDQLDAALSELDPPLLDGLTLRVSYARSIAQGQTVFNTSDQTAQEEVRALYSDVDDLL